MTIRTKRIILVSVLSVFCVIMFILLISTFNKDYAVPADAPTEEIATDEPEVVVIVTAAPVKRTAPPETTAPPESENAENKKTADGEQSNEEPVINQENDKPTEVIEQNFPEITKPELSEKSANHVPDEELMNPDKKPNEQTAPQQTTAPNTPYNGQKRDGKVYVEGFGWVVDEGGGVVQYTDTEMYENGNKIGTFG